MKKNFYYPLIIIFLVSFAGCGGSKNGGVKNWESSTAAAKLLDARALWAKNVRPDYNYTWDRHNIFFDSRIVTATVRANELVSMTYVGTDEVPAISQGNFETIESWFDFIDDLITNYEPDRLSITYNEQLGYPESIVVDYYIDAVDDENTYHIYEFH